MATYFKKVCLRTYYYVDLFSSSFRTKWVLFIFYCLCVILVQGLNIAWFDEGHELLIIRESKSWLQFIQAMRYEGTPWLIHTIIYILNILIGNVWISALFVHVFILLAIGWLICMEMRLSAILAAIVIFSPALFEYVENIRQYPAAILALLLFALAYIKKPQSLEVRVWLFLLAQVCVTSFLISGSLFLWLIVKNYKNKRYFYRDVIIGGIVGVVTMVQLIPAQDLVVGLKGWNIIPVEEFFWGLVWMLGIVFLTHNISGVLCGVCLIAITIFLVKRHEMGLNVWASILSVFFVLTAVSAIMFLKYLQCERHLYLVSWTIFILIYIFFITENYDFRILKRGLLIFLFLMCPFLIYEFEGYLIARVILPKTSAIAAARYILSYGGELLLYPEMNSEAVLYYLNDRLPVYSVARGKYITRLEWNDPSVDYARFRGIHECVDLQKLKNRIEDIPFETIKKRPSILVSTVHVINTGLGNPFFFETQNARIRLLRSFRWSRREWYLIYSIEPKEI
jgi:hypothetical protein